jgi:putative aldouronate transport system substrate-binding protein
MKIFKRFLATILIVAFAMSVVACGGSSSNNQTTAAAAGTTAAGTTAAATTAAAATEAAATEAAKDDSTTAAAATTAAPAPAPAATTAAASGGQLSREEFVGGPLDPFAETVTITQIVGTNANRYFHEGDDYNENAWTRKILADLNIKVELAYSVDENSLQERLNTLLVSGDLPDIFHSYSRVFMRDAQDAGMLAPLDYLMDNCATPAILGYRDMFPDSFTGASLNGVLYGFPDGTDNFHTPQYIWIRDDWLENTNSQPPKTVDEFIELARKFTFEDPNKDGSKTYGLAMTSTVTEGMAALLCAQGVPAMMWGGVYYRRDGQITYSWIQPEVKNVLTILRNMYVDGVIDPEFVVKDGPLLETDIATNKIGMYDYRNWGTWYPFNIIFQSDEVVSRPYPIPTIDGVDFKIGVENNFGGSLAFLKSSYEYPEAFMKIINLFNLTCYESLSMDDFETYYSNSYHGLKPVGTWIANELYAPQIHEAMKNGTYDQLPAAIKPYYDFVVNFESGADRSAPAFGTWGQTFERGSMAIALYDYRDAGHTVQTMMGLDGFIPQASLDDGGILGEIINTAFTEMILGDRPIDSFDDFVKDWLANGGQKILNEMTEYHG